MDSKDKSKSFDNIPLNASSSSEQIAEKASQIKKLMDQLSRMNTGSYVKDISTATHKFWNSQPVQNSCEEVTEDGPLEAAKDISEIKAEPYPLTPDFVWSLIDIDNASEKEELYNLLNLNYVEDVESLFRFDYPSQFLEWALKPPGWKKEWHLGVRVAQSNKLVAFISAIPATLGIRSRTIEAVEVNFLCIHKKLRAKRLAPLLIKEITRRVNLFGIFQALYTAGALLPGLLTKARYHHRPLNFKKLLEVGFTAVPLGKTVDQMSMKYHLAKTHQLGDSLRPMKDSDVPQVHALLSKYVEKKTLRPVLNEEEVRHWLMPRNDIMYTFIMETADGSLSDFVSFYSLPSTVVHNDLHSKINVAYLFYYAADTTPLSKLVHSALVMARDLKFDVFNCVEIMENETFLNDLKFGEGDGYLHYYLFNWRLGSLKPSETATVML